MMGAFWSVFLLFTKLYDCFAVKVLSMDRSQFLKGENGLPTGFICSAVLAAEAAWTSWSTKLWCKIAHFRGSSAQKLLFFKQFLNPKSPP